MSEVFKILIIDDDDVDRMTLARALAKAQVNADIQETTTGHEGIETLQRQEFDCVFLDYMLPDNDGLMVLRLIADAGIDSPVVMLTGQGDTQLAVEIMKAGASDYLSKGSLTPETLSRSLHHAVRIHRAELEQKRAEEEQKKLLKKLQTAQEQLIQSEKMASIGQLAAGVAHEINNPVGYISSNIGSLEQYTDEIFQLLEAYEKSESQIADNDTKQAIRALRETLDIGYLKDDIKSLVRESLEGVSRVKQIVQDLKDFSHVDEAEWQWVDLHAGLNSTLNIVQNEIKYKADVIKEYGELPEVECFPSQINQVFMNLLVNAAHSIEERGVITLRTGIENDDVWIEVRDTGLGISKENLTRIFDPFFTTKAIGQGTGLGLSLSYGIVQNHGGRIEVNSEISKGTSFKIWLPIRQSKAHATHQ